MAAPADLCELTDRQVLEWSGPLKVSYLTRTNFGSWPIVLIAHRAGKRPHAAI